MKLWRACISRLHRELRCSIYARHVRLPVLAALPAAWFRVPIDDHCRWLRYRSRARRVLLELRAYRRPPGHVARVDSGVERRVCGDVRARTHDEDLRVSELHPRSARSRVVALRGLLLGHHDHRAVGHCRGSRQHHRGALFGSVSGGRLPDDGLGGVSRIERHRPRREVSLVLVTRALCRLHHIPRGLPLQVRWGHPVGPRPRRSEAWLVPGRYRVRRIQRGHSPRHFVHDPPPRTAQGGADGRTARGTNRHPSRLFLFISP